LLWNSFGILPSCFFNAGCKYNLISLLPQIPLGNITQFGISSKLFKYRAHHISSGNLNHSGKVVKSSRIKFCPILDGNFTPSPMDLTLTNHKLAQISSGNMVQFGILVIFHKNKLNFLYLSTISGVVGNIKLVGI
jgi:hypothetical protein